MPKIPYGYAFDQTGQPMLIEKHAAIVRSVYNHYLAGYSLGKIVDILFENQIPSPTGKDRWTRAMIDKMLSNQKYIAGIIGFEQFLLVQIEKNERSNIDMDTGKRIAKRYTTPVMQL